MEKCLVFGLILIICFSFFACGKSNNTVEQSSMAVPTTEANTGTEAPTTTAVPEVIICSTTMPSTTKSPTVAESTEKVNKTIKVTCTPFSSPWGSDANAKVIVETNFEATKVVFTAVASDGAEYGPLSCERIGSKRWEKSVIFYVESTYTLTATASDSNGETIQNSTIVTYPFN